MNLLDLRENIRKLILRLANLVREIIKMLDPRLGRASKVGEGIKLNSNLDEPLRSGREYKKLDPMPWGNL